MDFAEKGYINPSLFKSNSGKRCFAISERTVFTTRSITDIWQNAKYASLKGLQKQPPGVFYEKTYS